MLILVINLKFSDTKCDVSLLLKAAAWLFIIEWFRLDTKLNLILTKKTNQMVRLLLFKLVSNLVIGFQLGYHSFQLGYL